MGDGVAAEARCAVFLKNRLDARQPKFMVVDPNSTSLGRGASSPGAPLGRGDVVNRPIAKEIYAIVDEVIVGNSHVAEMDERAMLHAEPPRWRRWLRNRLGRRRRRSHPVMTVRS